MTGRKWSVSETSTNVDLRAGKIMHNTFLKRRAEPLVSVATGREKGRGECSHKFAIMQMPGRSPREAFSNSGSLLYGAIVRGRYPR